MIANGFVNSGVFLLRNIMEKLVDIVESKIIHEGVDMNDFKQLVSVLENAHDYIKNHLLGFVEVEERISEESYLGDLFCEAKDKFPIKMLEEAKQRKVMDYLNRMHKNALTVEMKESLEN